LTKIRSLLAISMLAALTAATPALHAEAQSPKECKSSQDCALDAFKTGQVKPLSEVLAVVRAKVPGEVVKVELEREDGVWVYEIKVLTPSGRRREVEINAQTLAIIKID
jgi:uncharacterized membrane protein YkoI